jgi:hypothetical protein
MAKAITGLGKASVEVFTHILNVRGEIIGLLNEFTRSLEQNEFFGETVEY